ncbi:MAG: hypothetical protein H0X02_02055 [Nitrosomonas sp.]|nr:hypothetical protein [Nitrosomonas sp.]
MDQYLRSISHPDIFAVGDIAAFMPTPLPKAGVYEFVKDRCWPTTLLATLKKYPLLAFKPQKRFLKLINHRRSSCRRFMGPLFGHGKWVWLWINHIERGFMAHSSQNR